MIDEIKLFLRVLMTPSCWIRNERYCPIWDAKLREQLKNPNFSYVSEYTINFNGVRLWVGNYPYSCFQQYPSLGAEVMPSRRTCFLISDALTRHNCSQFD